MPSSKLTLPGLEPTLDDQISTLDEELRDSIECQIDLDGFPSVPSDLELTFLDDAVPTLEKFLQEFNC